jgi:hypothetical protein
MLPQIYRSRSSIIEGQLEVLRRHNGNTLEFLQREEILVAGYQVVRFRRQGAIQNCVIVGVAADAADSSRRLLILDELPGHDYIFVF